MKNPTQWYAEYHHDWKRSRGSFEKFVALVQEDATQSGPLKTDDNPKLADTDFALGFHLGLSGERLGSKNFPKAWLDGHEKGVKARQKAYDDLNRSKISKGSAARLNALVLQASSGDNEAAIEVCKLLGIKEKSPIFCGHANEVPVDCPCDDDCYCKDHTCKS